MITVFTPTYNRGYILENLYKSLLSQGNKDFEWLIVDDGSTDDTKDKVSKWINENKIKIRYYFQENKGKSQAHNYGVELAEKELFVCVDSDDSLEKNAIQVIIDNWEKQKKSNIIGMVGNRKSPDGKIIGKSMPTEIETTTIYDLYEKYKHTGDTILIYKSEIIKKYSFPYVEGEKFIPETYLYDLLDQEGKMGILREPLYICEYLSDGYTKNSRKNIYRNPRGYMIHAKQRMKISKSLKVKIKAACKYNVGRIISKTKIESDVDKFLVVLSSPIAYIYYLLYYRGLNNE